MPMGRSEPTGWISAIILAAGSSTRLGRPKQLLQLDGKVLLQHVIDSVSSAGFNEVIVVLGHEARTIEKVLVLPVNCRVVVNADHAAGQSTSLRAGVGAADDRAEGVAIFVGDQPRLPDATIVRVLEEFRARRAPIVRSMWRGTPGHPVYVDRSLWPRLTQLTGDVGVRALIPSVDDVQEVQIDEDAVADVDTWEQYLAIGGQPEAST